MQLTQKLLDLMLVAVTALTLATLVVHGQKTKPEEKPNLESPRLAALWRELAAGNQSALQQFWQEVTGKTPLVETIPNNGRYRRVTFLWRGGEEVRGLRVEGNIPLEREQRMLNRLPNTDVWFVTVWYPISARFSYGFARGEQDKLTPDQLNPLSSGRVELPGAPPQPWIIAKPDVPKGSVTPEKLKSEILKEERTVSVYTPPGYEARTGDYGLLMVFDGEAYRSAVPTPTILDNLIANKKILPLVALLVDSGETRDRDLQCSPEFADFLAKELVPWAHRRYRFNADPKRTIVAGSSYGGLSAACCAFRYPKVFGNVLSQSGSFGYYPGWHSEPQSNLSPYGWLIRQFVTTPKLPIRFYLEAGLFETNTQGDILPQNRRLRDVLEAKGYLVVYSEFAGGHEYENWRGSLADGLIALAGKEK